MAKLKPNQFYLPSGALITEHPILFSTEMVKANLEDRKTMTRRTKGLSLNVDGIPKKNWEYTECYLGVDPKGNLVWMASAKHIPTGQTYGDISPYGMPGDLLWVKETWLKSEFPEVDGPFEYRASMANPNALWNKGIWKPSIHMPKAASRIWAMIEDIRVERVTDITEADSIAEGIERIVFHDVESWKRYDGYEIVTSSPIVSFWSLWASINGEDSWHSNPWVWVIKYRILSKTGRPSDDVIEKNYLELMEKEVVNG